jgi:hypothetical protein
MNHFPLSPALPSAETEVAALVMAATTVPSWALNTRQLCNWEMLLNGGYPPLAGYVGQADYDRVLAEMRLADGTVWPLPVVLDVTPEFTEPLAAGQSVAPRDAEGLLLARGIRASTQGAEVPHYRHIGLCVGRNPTRRGDRVDLPVAKHRIHCVWRIKPRQQPKHAGVGQQVLAGCFTTGRAVPPRLTFTLLSRPRTKSSLSPCRVSGTATGGRSSMRYRKRRSGTSSEHSIRASDHSNCCWYFEDRDSQGQCNRNIVAMKEEAFLSVAGYGYREHGVRLDVSWTRIRHL